MVSLIFYVASSIANLLPKYYHTFRNYYNVPFPNVFHEVLDESYIEQFDEIFVIGDVHGCHDELEALLVKSDTKKDSVLKIFVGDLVNKGPKSIEVLRTVYRSKSMLSVRGNHDEIVLKEYFESRNNSEVKLSEKYSWIPFIKEKYIKMLVELPYTISIPSLNSIIVHAGLVPGVPLSQNDPNDMIHMRNIVEANRFWDRSLVALHDTSVGEPWAQVWGGPERVYFGHDARRSLQFCYRATGLDSGCVYGNYLSGIFIHGPRTGRLISVKAAKVYAKT